MDLLLNIANVFYKLASEAEYKTLRNFNFQALRKASDEPPENKAEYYLKLNERALHGPIFDAEILDYFHKLSATSFPSNNYKTYIRWLANYINSSRNFPSETKLRYVADYLNQNDLDTNLSFEDLYALSKVWHETGFHEKVDTGEYKTRDVVYDFGNGYTIVKVPPEDLELEGDKMQHCIGGYKDWVQSGGAIIYSLRGTNNNPHVTIEFDPIRKKIIQIKGKQNKQPIPKYSAMVQDWLTKTFDEKQYNRSIDYLTMSLSDIELIQLYKKNKDNNFGIDIARALIEKFVELKLFDKIKIFMNSPDPWVREGVASYISEKYLPQMMNDKEMYVRYCVAQRIDPKFLTYMINDNYNVVRREVAKRIDLIYLPLMLDDKDPDVLLDVSKRIGTQHLPQMLEMAYKLPKGENIYRTPEELKEQFLLSIIERDWIIPDKYVPKLIQESDSIKMALIKRIHPKYLRDLLVNADYGLHGEINEAMPAKYWAKLIYDKNAKVRRAAATYVDPEYLQFMIHDNSPVIRETVAFRIDVEFLPDMIEDPYDRVREIVSSRINSKYLPRMIFDRSHRVRSHVVHRIDSKYLPQMINYWAHDEDSLIFGVALYRMSIEELHKAKELADDPEVIAKINNRIYNRW